MHGYKEYLEHLPKKSGLYLIEISYMLKFSVAATRQFKIQLNYIY